MRIIKKGIMPDGTAIQIEDWADNYSCYSRCGTVAAYPIAKSSIKKTAQGGVYCGPWYYPEAGKKFRVSLNFGCGLGAEQVFNKLISGEAQLRDFAEYMHYPEHAQCL